MKFDITWSITAIIAVSSFLSPIFVAIINNRHHAKLRKMELKHDEYLRQLDLQQISETRQFEIYYADKKEAFSEFLTAAGIFSKSRSNPHAYETLHSSLNKALLFCNSQNQEQLCVFLDYVDTKLLTSESSALSRSEYSKKLNAIALSLNQELESTKPVLNCK